MQDLIERLERATEPDRTLQNDVLFACGWTMHGGIRHSVWTSPRGDEFLDGDQPDPVGSIDAALTLVPEGWAWSIHVGGCYATGERLKPRAELAEPIQTEYGPGIGIRAQINAATPAIALCIASLRARMK